MFKRVHLRSWERGFLFQDGEFRRVLEPGTHWLFDPLFRARVDRMSMRQTVSSHGELDLFAHQLEGREDLRVLHLTDGERALVWEDGRFVAALEPGRHLIWTALHEVRVEGARPGAATEEGAAAGARFEHPELAAILASGQAQEALGVHNVPEHFSAVAFLDGKSMGVLGQGRHAFWQGLGQVQLLRGDRRELVLDVGGQELMTRDKVTLRLNLTATIRVTDPSRATAEVSDFRQAVYRDAQLVLRAAVGARELDELLADKDALAQDMTGALATRAAQYGVKVVTLGIKDVILPGEMKELMNRVIEARKAAEAAVITRREETAAMRSQANTARLLEKNEALMRMRELELLEKLFSNSNLNVVLGEKGLADRVFNLL